MSNEIKDLIKAIEELIVQLSKPKVADHQEFWNDKTCAAYFMYSASSFRQKIACKPSLPKRIVLNPDGINETKRWIKKEVINWALAHKVVG